MMAQVVAGKSARDVLFLQAFGVAGLPIILVASALFSFVLAEVSSLLLVRFGPFRTVPWLFCASGLGFGVEFLLFRLSPQGVAVVLFLHVVGAGAVLSSGFWSVVNERFDPHSIKGYARQITAGGSLGGVLGGILGWQLTFVGDQRSVLLLLGSLNASAALGLFGLGNSPRLRPAPAVEAESSELPTISPLRQIFTSPLLRNLVWVVLLGAAVQALLDYALSAHALATFGRGQPLATFFCWFYVANNALGLLGQLGIAEAVLRRFGLVGAVASVPAVTSGVSLLAAIFPGIASSTSARSAEFVTRGALFRAGYETLFTPLSQAQRRRTKAVIDVGADRLGTALGSALLLLLLLAAPVDHPVPLVMLAAAGISLSSLWLCTRLGPQYAAALEASLRAGTVTASAGQFEDSLSLSTLGSLAVDIDRRQVLDAIAQRRRHLTPPLTPTVPSPNGPGSSEQHSRTDQELLRTLLRLTSGEHSIMVEVLRHQPRLDLRSTPWVIELLQNDALAADATTALSRQMPAITGQLVDALLDPAQAMVVRHRLPRLITLAPFPRAIVALVMALETDSFSLQFSCAKALFRITANHPPMDALAPLIWKVVRGELTKQSPEQSLGKRLQYLYALTGTLVKREPLKMALNALRGADPRLRGTAIEYLSGVLPQEILVGYLELLDVEYLGPRPR